MDIINCLFRFFDFFVVIGLAFYCIKYYVIPGVEKLMREYGLLMYNLESDCKNVQLQVQSILENIQDQDRHFQMMQEKFLIWQKKCDEKTMLQQLAQEKIDASIEQSYVVRLNYIKNNTVLQEQLPDIIAGTTQKLQNRFSTIDTQKQYIDQLIQLMKEKS